MLAGCSTVDENPKKNIQLGLITTPPAYYTTQKARYLGEKYKNNLDRLVERIVRNPKTANLQFANNIASVGGIGFFTHSATNSVDERFLEIILGVPDTFDAHTDHNAKVRQVFSLYGTELLSILSSDSDIYQEKEVSGYGLNLSWRNLVQDPAGTRVSLERATLYFPKARVRSFLQGDVSQNTFLGEAVIFAVVDDGPMKLVSYRPLEPTPDLRRPIQEEALVAEENRAKPGAPSENVVSPPPASNRPVTAKEPKKSSTQSSSQASEKTAELKAPSASEEKFDDGSEAVLPADKPTEVAFPSSASIKPSKSKEPSSVIQVGEEILAANQDPGDRTSPAPLEQNKTEPQEASPEVDFTSTPESPVLASIPDAGDAAVSSKEQLNDQPQFENQQSREVSSQQSVATSLPRVLQGFVIQLAFGEMRDARRWAETLERRGFSVSLTEAGGGSVRVRIGNFAGREEAESHLQALRREGLKGIVLNLPQPYRLQVDPPGTEEAGNTLSAVQ
ncbi:MAG TPA: SPOR domain-containing protein [Candidatus Binatia bacterium]|nr:SPOR domain-containing protein [Candidatus Binatia bacterium]